MVSAPLASFPLAKHLKAQQVSSNLSVVRPISCPVDPMRRYSSREPFAVDAPEDSKQLESMQNLIEWAYGFRMPTHAGQRLTRRAPSAGALYPTEVFLVTKIRNRWHVLYYEFFSHSFYDAPEVDAQQVASALFLGPKRQAILFHSVLWRTVQRYGVRGYRYCLLDGAHVAANFMLAACTTGVKIVADPGLLTTQLEDLMKLGNGEALIASLICEVTAHNRTGCRPNVATPPANRRSGTFECAPALSPLLSRVTAFHRSTLYATPKTFTELAISNEDSPDHLEFWAAQRYSAKQFTGECVSAEQYDYMIQSLRRQPALRFPQSYALIPYVICLNVEGRIAGCERLDTRLPLVPSINTTDLKSFFWRACQKQQIALNSAFAIVIAVEQSELCLGDPAAYRHTILNAGVLCAELYREAARCFLGTTSIGGFSDEEMAGLLGDLRLHPIVIQAFGVPVNDAEKVDSARIATLGSRAVSRKIEGAIQ